MCKIMSTETISPSLNATDTAHKNDYWHDIETQPNKQSGFEQRGFEPITTQINAEMFYVTKKRNVFQTSLGCSETHIHSPN